MGTTNHGRPAASSAPGAVRVRLSGRLEDIEPVLALLMVTNRNCGYKIQGTGLPERRANRRDPGGRAYITVLVCEDSDDEHSGGTE